MNNDTVPVTVTLPKPPEGKEWYLEKVDHTSQEGFGVLRHRRVAPPESMAVEMLLGDVLVWAAGRTTPAIDQRAFNAARKALREAEECGYRFDECTDTVSCSHYCRQPKGHAGAHSPEH